MRTSLGIPGRVPDRGPLDRVAALAAEAGRELGIIGPLQRIVVLWRGPCLVGWQCFWRDGHSLLALGGRRYLMGRRETQSFGPAAGTEPPDQWQAWEWCRGRWEHVGEGHW